MDLCMKNKSTLTLSLLLAVANLFSQGQKGAAPLTVSQPSTNTGQTYAVVVGISDYQDKDIPDLRFADKDAEAFANFLRSPAGGALDGDHLKVLTNKEATMGQFAAALDWLWEVSKEGDLAIIYFSGHGDVEKKSITQPGYLLCWDAPSRVYMGGGAFALPMFQDVVTTLSAQNKAKVVVITDACRSGKLAGSSVGGTQVTGSNLARQYANEIKILSCQPEEYSIEGEQWGDGRGAFSYNLVNALYGLADGNNDLSVTLQEVGRYLEDHVTAEVAPVSQVPMVLGNRSERLASVDAKLLSALRSGKTSQMQMLSPIETRGMEDDVLAGVDTTTRDLYRLFKKALKDKIFLAPATACADSYYKKLIAEPKMQRLHTTMTRNYAATLQDDAQQTMNIWLAADVQQLECIGKSLRLEPIPQQLQRAAELLGEEHYMYRSLQARKLLFLGISEMKHNNPDEVLGRKCLSIFRQSLVLESNSPLPWHRMSLVYANILRMPDSAFVCARQARNLAPNWVLPYADLAFSLYQQNKLELANQALLEAEAIDSLHPYVFNRRASWYASLRGQLNLEKALVLFEKYRNIGGPTYPCWFNDYGTVLLEIGRYVESEANLKEANSLDSANTAPCINLGILYIQTSRYPEAEQQLKKALALDSANSRAWHNLGRLHTRTRRYPEGEICYKKAILLDSLTLLFWADLGFLYFTTQRYTEAEPIFWHIVTADSNFISGWNNLGSICRETNRYDESEKMYHKAFALDADFMPTYRNYARLKIKMGDLQAAFAYLEKAIQKGYDDYQGMQTDASFAPLREQKELWEALMKKYFPD